MDVRRFFEDRLRRHGDSPETLDWNEQSQRRRFEVLAQVGDFRGKSVLDLGSGLGDLYAFLVGRVSPLDYLGLDFSHLLVERARARFPETRFEVCDVLREGLPRGYDFILSSGLHNLETGNNDAEMTALLRRAWEVAGEAVAINMISTRADRVDEGVHKYDIGSMFSAALGLTRFVVARHDYMPHDFTLFLYRKPSAR